MPTPGWLRSWYSITGLLILRSAGRVKLATVLGSGKDWKPNSADEAVWIFPVRLERGVGEPDFPQMEVSAQWRVIHLPLDPGGMRAAGDVGRQRVRLRQRRGDDLLEKLPVGIPTHL